MEEKNYEKLLIKIKDNFENTFLEIEDIIKENIQKNSVINKNLKSLLFAILYCSERFKKIIIYSFKEKNLLQKIALIIKKNLQMNNKYFFKEDFQISSLFLYQISNYVGISCDLKKYFLKVFFEMKKFFNTNNLLLNLINYLKDKKSKNLKNINFLENVQNICNEKKDNEIENYKNKLKGSFLVNKKIVHSENLKNQFINSQFWSNSNYEKHYFWIFFLENKFLNLSIKETFKILDNLRKNSKISSNKFIILKIFKSFDVDKIKNSLKDLEKLRKFFGVISKTLKKFNQKDLEYIFLKFQLTITINFFINQDTEISKIFEDLIEKDLQNLFKNENLENIKDFENKILFHNIKKNFEINKDFFFKIQKIFKPFNNRDFIDIINKIEYVESRIKNFNDEGISKIKKKLQKIVSEI